MSLLKVQSQRGVRLMLAVTPHQKALKLKPDSSKLFPQTPLAGFLFKKRKVHSLGQKDTLTQLLVIFPVGI